MTQLLPELRRSPVDGVFDGELVSLDPEWPPSFERVCRRMLMRDESVPVTLVVFDALELDAESTMRLSYRRRSELFEGLDFARACEVGPRFEDGAALWAAIVDHRLEGVVAKRLEQPYRPGEARLDQSEEPRLAALCG